MSCVRPISDELADLAARVHARVVSSGLRLDPGGADAGRQAVRALVRGEAPLLAERLAEQVVAAVIDRALGLGPLESLLAQPGTTDVMVNGGGRVWVDGPGGMRPTDLAIDEREVLQLIERILAPLGRHVDRSRPVVDARLADGSRVHAVVRPLAVDGPCLTIRRFGARAVSLGELADPGVVALLRWAVRARCNLVVCGGAGAGKTTVLNALGAHLDPAERVVTIEDAAELRLPGDHVVRLESRPASAEGVGEVTTRDLVRAALRMRPDRLVVGEVRSTEAVDMLAAMNTGHDGSLSTCHANGPGDALRRLETLVLMGDIGLPHEAVREHLASALDLVVHVARRPDGRRRVAEVAEVGALDDRGRLPVRSLTDGPRLVGLPRRPRRAVDAPPPDPSWLDDEASR